MTKRTDENFEPISPGRALYLADYLEDLMGDDHENEAAIYLRAFARILSAAKGGVSEDIRNLAYEAYISHPNMRGHDASVLAMDAAIRAALRRMIEGE